MILSENIRIAESKDLDNILHLERQFGVYAFTPSMFKKRLGSYLFRSEEHTSELQSH